MALAYFLTWTTYGTRLHGDDRGTVDLDHNRRHTPTLASNDQMESWHRAQLKYPPVVFGTLARQIVDQAIRDHAAFRHWHIHALEVRTNHVHVVVHCPRETPPEKAMEEFKSWGTRRLRGMDLAPAKGLVWTDHGSTRWINEPDDLGSAIRYVRDWQNGRPAWEPETPAKPRLNEP